MKYVNPKSHDSLFKWLITSFTEEFFAHYFPDLKIDQYRFIDKEFISKYEALKESLKGDLFLVMEIESNQQRQEIAIQIEHQSERTDVSQRIFEYLCYVWLLKKQPVWSIVIYTDDAQWRKPVPNQFHYGFSSTQPHQCFHFDVIKVNQEKSSDLIKKHSLLCKLLALKANDKDIASETLIREIYQATAAMKDQLTADQRLLINQWVDFYKKIPAPTFQNIKQEFSMAFIETTISEHIFNQGKAEGEAKGKAEGEAKGKAEGKAEGLQGQISLLENLYQLGILSETQKNALLAPIQQQFNELTHVST